MLAIFSFLTGLADPISRITKAIADAKISHDKAQTDQEKIKSAERISQLEQQRAVMIAEAGSGSGWINASIRAGFALPFVIYNGKLVLWDKVLAWGSTDPLSPELLQVEMICIGFYFLHSAVGLIAGRR